MARRDSDPTAPESIEEAIHLALRREDLAEAWRLVGVRLKA